MLSNYVLQTTLDSMASNLNGAIANCIAFQKELLEQLLTENEELKAKLETANCEIQELYTSRQDDDANKLNELHCRHYRNNEEIRLLREFISDNDLDSPTFDELLRMYQSDYDALPY